MSDYEELMEYARLDGSEWGESAEALCNAYRVGRTFFSDELQDLLSKEIADWLTNVRENATIVEESETITRTVKSLEWD